ncbi:MAG: ABC transporter ATP-binding protein [Xanthomonadaceae bacterium]|nr:ABC transporter ATP-binding protein [Xanthomonadaceae bacterium]
MINVKLEVVLSAKGIKKSFHKSGIEIPVLRGIDFVLSRGERVAIIGASGAGKSTLLHVLGTLERPTNGELFFHGNQSQNILSWNDSKLAQFRNLKMGFVFQFHHLLPEFTALENVMLPALISGQTQSEARALATELLKKVGLEHRMGHKPNECSGGEQQRTAICRAIVMNPPVLFADELTGNLDSVNSQAVMELLVDLNERLGISIVLVTHDEQLAKKMHRVYHMRDGQFV